MNRNRIRKPGKTRGPVQRDAKDVMAELVVKLSQKLEPQSGKADEGQGPSKECLAPTETG